MENRDRKIVYNAELFIIFWKTRTRELLQSLMRLNLRLVKEVFFIIVGNCRLRMVVTAKEG